MYTYFPIKEMEEGARNAVIAPIERYGVSVYVDSDPDWVEPDFIVDPLDTEGLKLFRRFAAEFAAHYKTLKIKS